MKLRQVGGDVDWKKYGGLFVTKKLNNDEFDYWLFVEFINMEEATGDTSRGKYMVTIDVVAPDVAPRDDIESAFESMGFEVVPKDKLKIAIALQQYGVAATVWSDMGNNAEKLMQEAREETDKISRLFGFYMDKPLNRIGNTGWDFIRGNIG